MQTDFSAYLPQSEETTPFGIEVLGGGSAHIDPGQHYPPHSHPTGHAFDWERGRILHEYQVLLITKGKGTLETEASERIEFNAPFMFLVFPSVWHRYQPTFETGWQEHWIAFRGQLADDLKQQGILSPAQPTFDIGPSERVLRQFQLALDEIRAEAHGFRQIAATAIMQILALATNLPHRSHEENQPMRATVRKACFILRERADSVVFPEDLAAELKVGYTYFRRMFKRYTGLSPKQYHSQLRLQRIKTQLRDTGDTVNQIADRFGFNSPFHLSNWFKKQTNVSPSDWRQQVR